METTFWELMLMEPKRFGYQKSKHDLCLLGEHCYKAKASCANSWYLDSGCSRHMTGDKSRFLELKYNSGGVVTFGDKS
ncbi:hypothetical protein GQ457_04G017140 [Hibiscus cannabinus]